MQTSHFISTEVSCNRIYFLCSLVCEDSRKLVLFLRPCILPSTPQPVPLKAKEKRAPRRSPSHSIQHEKNPKSFHSFTVSSLENRRLLHKHKSCNFFMNLRGMQGLNPAPRHRTWQSMMKKNFRLHFTLATNSARSTLRVQAKNGTARAII